ncbi:MAG: hypothetical protein WC277_08270 [Bacilli bacterium]|jgi:hypothetical protein
MSNRGTYNQGRPPLKRIYVDRDVKIWIASLKILWNMDRENDVIKKLLKDAKKAQAKEGAP